MKVNIWQIGLKVASWVFWCVDDGVYQVHLESGLW